MESSEKKYVKVPWKSWIPLPILLLIVIVPVTFESGVMIFNMPIETFIAVWFSFVYYIAAALLRSYVIIKKDEGKEIDRA